MSVRRNLLPPWGAWIKCCPCKLSAVPVEWNRCPLTLIYCPANCFLHCLAAFPLSWSHTLSSNCDVLKCCRCTPLLRLLILACPHLSLSLVCSFSILVSLSHSLRRFCSVAPCSDWFVVMGLTLSSPESGVALFLLFSCRSLHPAFPSILRWQRSLGCICQSLRRCFGFYLSTVSELHVFIHIWCRALWWKWIGVYWEKDTKRVWLCSKPSELPT